MDQLDDVTDKAHDKNCFHGDQPSQFYGNVCIVLNIALCTAFSIFDNCQAGRRMRCATYSLRQLLGRSVKCRLSVKTHVEGASELIHLKEFLLVGLLASLHELHAIVHKFLGRLEDL